MQNTNDTFEDKLIPWSNGAGHGIGVRGAKTKLNKNDDSGVYP